MTPVKRARVEYRLVVTHHGERETSKWYQKRDLKHARDDAAKYDPDDPRRSVRIETRTVTAWSKLEEE